MWHDTVSRPPQAVRIDLNLAHLLVALEQCRSFKGASAQLGVSESKLRNALALLRLQLGDPLFSAREGVLHPTAKALHLAARLHPAIDAIVGALAPGLEASP